MGDTIESCSLLRFWKRRKCSFRSAEHENRTKTQRKLETEKVEKEQEKEKETEKDTDKAKKNKTAGKKVRSKKNKRQSLSKPLDRFPIFSLSSLSFRFCLLLFVFFSLSHPSKGEKYCKNLITLSPLMASGYCIYAASLNRQKRFHETVEMAKVKKRKKKKPTEIGQSEKKMTEKKNKRERLKKRKPE